MEKGSMLKWMRLGTSNLPPKCQKNGIFVLMKLDVPFQTVLLSLSLQIVQYGLHDPLIVTERLHRFYVRLRQLRSGDLARKLGERDGVENDDGEEVGFEAVTVYEELLNQGVGGEDILDLLEGDVFSLSEFHDVLYMLCQRLQRIECWSA